MAIKQEALAAFRDKLESLKGKGIVLSEQVMKAMESLENPHYRIAVLGMYQVGKSTLVNRVFLGNAPLLKEGRGNCTTAVATDIEYGVKSQLSVYHWDDENQVNETLVETIANPTLADVEKATVSTNMATRGQLAQKVSRICISTPNDALKNYTIIDTPGLDDPNRELLLNTTWRIIPNADAAILVVECNQLSDLELNLISKEIAEDNGIMRMMVLVSYKPEKQLDESQRQAILETIKAQLESIGRQEIPVEMYCYDSSVEDIMSDIAEIRLTIRTFLQKNALKSRLEKVAWLLRRELVNQLLAIATKIKSATTSEEEKERCKLEIEKEIKDFIKSSEKAFENFKDEMKPFVSHWNSLVDGTVEMVFKQFLEELTKQKNLAAKGAFLRNAPTYLKSDLLDNLSILLHQMNDNFNRLVTNYMDGTQDARTQIAVFWEDDSKYLPQTHEEKQIPVFTPSKWLKTLEKIAFFQSLKLDFKITDVLTEKLLIKEAQKCLEKSKEEVSFQIKEQFNKAMINAFQDAKAEIEDYNKTYIQNLRAFLMENSGKNIDIPKLERIKAELESVLDELDSILKTA